MALYYVKDVVSHIYIVDAESAESAKEIAEKQPPFVTNRQECGAELVPKKDFRNDVELLRAKLKTELAAGRIICGR